ncbi:hypothetical protein [Bradyrhizobium japonicum]|uniref:hypothetical protein n=1 Tax=Bradyrhizobium japonicum TaxID=375 RepID=UPI0033964AC9
MLAQPLKIADTPAYWTHKIGDPTGPVAIGRMSQLVDFDPRLSETARLVYRFLINWYHHEHGDALLSQRHVATVMKKRAPDGAECPSRSAVSRAIILLLETGWVARTYRGRGRNKSASRYIPVFNVLDLAEQGRFPELAQRVGRFDDPENRPTARATTGPAGGPVHASSGPAGGPKTLLQDPGTDPGTCSDIGIPQASPAAEGGVLAGGFDALAAAYAKAGDNLRSARLAFNAIDPDEAEQARMVRAAESWRASAKGARMSLERWLKEKRWLTTEEFKQDNRPSHRYPSCVVTWVKPIDGGGARVKYRDENGGAQTQQLDADELEYLQSACSSDRPACESLSEDLHELVGAHFWIDVDGCFEPYRSREAA